MNELSQYEVVGIWKDTPMGTVMFFLVLEEVHPHLRLFSRFAQILGNENFNFQSISKNYQKLSKTQWTIINFYKNPDFFPQNYHEKSQFMLIYYNFLIYSWFFFWNLVKFHDSFRKKYNISAVLINNILKKISPPQRFQPTRCSAQN